MMSVTAASGLEDLVFGSSDSSVRICNRGSDGQRLEAMPVAGFFAANSKKHAQSG